MGKDVEKGIELSPPLAGTWRRRSDTRLVFTLAPKTDWPVGEDITIKLAKQGLLADTVLLEDYKLHFSTAQFAAIGATPRLSIGRPISPGCPAMIASVYETLSGT